LARIRRRGLERDRKQRLQAIGEARITIDAPEEYEARAQPAGTSVWPWAVAAVLAAPDELESQIDQLSHFLE